MTPFLERLAARSLGAMPVLQPRRASRFEATDTSGAPEVVAETESSSPVRAAEAPAPSQVFVPATATSRAPEAAGPPPPRREPSQDLGTPAKPALTHEVFTPEIERPREKAPLLAAPEPVFRLHEVQVPASPASLPPSPLLPFSQAREAQPLLAASPHHPAFAEPLPAQRREPKAALPPPSPERREDIHISIGRIEIRALPTKAPQAPRRTAESPASTLDAYLQQRSHRRTP
ncbi:hypothetical protein GETHLI_26330 [Geothrix limicola]|uniref:Uncharacterized protein n=1 Tax=Geothrix limicola TaxID=2927978 RepID=A0ABQ5QHW5_9BACT|nr:hypothetical protein [Geothrix limicola]GLH74131.1 hypothetical protein GETHLI_26330 [Geothrix limicola]